MQLRFDMDNTYYEALLRRDAAFEGRIWVGVATTGVFCRLTCPARKPKRENCAFYGSIAGCLEAGFRPCKRCHPVGTAAGADVVVQELLAALEAAPEHRWSEADVRARGHDPSTVRRSFKRQFGLTFLDMARQARLRHGAQALARGETVLAAQLDAGWDGPSAFRAAFSGYLGLRPSQIGAGGRLQADWIETPLGPMVAVADDRALYLLEFAERRALPAELKRLWQDAKGDFGFGRLPPVDMAAHALGRFFAGEDERPDVPLAPGGTPFQQAVWDQLRQIPAGETRSYGALARALGKPDAVRAVARANGANRIAILIPCHRVLAADGGLTGYGGGLWRKQRLIEVETQYQERRDELG